MRNVIILLLCFFMSNVNAQESQSFWQTANESLINVAESNRSIIPSKYQTLQLDVLNLKSYLTDAPEEFSTEARQKAFLLDLPMDDGSMVTFSVYNSSVMMDGLAAKYPELKTYAGHSVSEKGMKLRFSVTPLGFHGVINKLFEGDVIYIDPYADNQTAYYISYNVHDHVSDIPDDQLICGLDHGLTADHKDQPIDLNPVNSNTPAATLRGAGEIVNIRQYRLAMSCTGNWGSVQGTAANALAKMVSFVNRLNQIFEIDNAIRAILIDDNDQLVFMDPGTDPYIITSGQGSGGNMISSNTTIVNSIIGAESYDYGHILNGGCDVGGVAFLGAVCGNNKAGGVTCSTGGIEYVVTRITAHEMGHSFNAPHTWNLCQTDNLDNISSGTAYEPGSGNTIMSYFGVCNPSQNVEDGQHDYYHVNSLERMYTFTTTGPGNNCAEIIPTNNHYPDITLPYNNGFYIPISTPFELEAVATDEENDPLTFTWEQYNLSPLNTSLGSPMGNEPSFRSYFPAPSPLRVFPKMQDVVNNTTTKGEVLPTYSRNLTFRCSVRDNNPEIGGASWAEMSFEVTNEAGPFKVSYPNSDTVVWKVGDYNEVIWDVANTDNNLVNCQQVNIKLSFDGGYTYPITLAENVPNDGTHFVVVPDQISTTLRVRIEAVGNIFFDISNANFEIIPATEAGYSFDATPYQQQVCLPSSAIIDLPMLSLLNFNDPVTFSVTGLPNGAVANFTNNPALPNTGSQLTIDMSGADPITDVFEVVIEGIAPGVDTIYRSAFLDVVSNDFSTLALTGPVTGAQAVVELPTFTWSATPNASSYEIQVATSPSFSAATIVDEVSGLTVTNYTTNVLLEKSTPHYWRVRPVNACGPGPYTTISTFHTEVFSCANYVSTNVPISISSQGTPTVESFIDVPQGGTISDLNLAKIKGQHNLVKHITVSLKSPEGTEVQLFSNICPGFNTQLFDLGIDDGAPSAIACPPIGGATYLPQSSGALATFNGENSEGLWKLLVKVNSDDGSGGSLQDWSMQICSNSSPSAPFIVNNNVLLVPPGAFNYVLIDQLLCEDNDNTAQQITYTLLIKPENGNLLFNGNPLEVGGTFRQSTINAGNLTYEHMSGAGLTDAFTFTVSDGEGGWVGPTVFQIEMDENATVGTKDPLSGNKLLVYPNPTKDILNVKLASPVNAVIQARLFNIQGQLIATQSEMNGMDILTFQTNHLSAGMYFVEVELDGQSLTQKVAVYK